MDDEARATVVLESSSDTINKLNSKKSDMISELKRFEDEKLESAMKLQHLQESARQKDEANTRKVIEGYKKSR